MKYEIIDSHRMLSQKKKEALADFFCEVKEIDAETAMGQVEFCDWFEKEYAVKWLEMLVFDGPRVVGYLRCLRNPEKNTEWLIGDVHVSYSHRQRGIATNMYGRVIDEVTEFEAAEKIITSVHPENVNSVALHEKMEFEDTGKRCVFPGFYFLEEETAYELPLYKYLPLPQMDVDKLVEKLLPLWTEYLEKKLSKTYFAEEGEYEEEKKRISATAKSRLRKIMSQSLQEHIYDFDVIWCGNRMVGFTYYNDNEEIYYNSESNEQS